MISKYFSAENWLPASKFVRPIPLNKRIGFNTFYRFKILEASLNVDFFSGRNIGLVFIYQEFYKERGEGIIL